MRLGLESGFSCLVTLFHLPYLPRPPKVHFPTGDSSPPPSPNNP